MTADERPSGRRVEPWGAWVASRPACHLRAAVPVGALLEVRVDEHALADEPHVRELRVVCAAGEREPGNATKVAKVLDDAVRRVEQAAGVRVQVLPWASALDDS